MKYAEDEKLNAEFSFHYYTLTINARKFLTSASGDEGCLLTDKVSHMKEGQNLIYWLSPERRKQVAKSAFVECLKNFGYEIVYITHSFDAYIIEKLKEFQCKQFVSVTEEGLDLPIDEKKHKEDSIKLFEAMKSRVGQKSQENSSFTPFFSIAILYLSSWWPNAFGNQPRSSIKLEEFIHS